MAGEDETEEQRQAKLYRRNTKRLRRTFLERFLMAMKEDLAEWLSSLMNDDMTAINFMSKLDNGVLLCEHANLVQKYAEEYMANLDADKSVKIPLKTVHYRERGAFKGSFIARDNVANFISWCRDIGIPDVVLFETEDLVLHKNEKTVVLTLLDVARKAAKYGVKPPQLVELEEEIDREIEEDKKMESTRPKSRVEKVLELEEENDLDQLVHDVVDACSCSSKFLVKKIGDGKYKFGSNKQLIFVRVMRHHVMVRVGGGWDTLEHYVNKHDPCRTHVAGRLDRRGRAEKMPTQRVSTIMEINSDGASVCSSESFGSGDGQNVSSISPDSEDYASETSFTTCSSHRSSMHQESDEEAFPIQSSRSEPIYLQQSKDETDNNQKTAVCRSKSETYTKFSQRKLSLMDDNLKDSDIYLTRNPSDNWLRRQLNERKQSAQTHDLKGTTQAEAGNMTVESIKKKYGKHVKERTGKRGEISTPKSRRKTSTNPNPVKELQEGKSPTMESRNNPQYRSWDQSTVGAKRRKDTMRGTCEMVGRKTESNKDPSSGIPKLIKTPQRPFFRKSYTLDVSTLKSLGIRRRGSDVTAPQKMQREISSDSISRNRVSKLPVPTFRKTGHLIQNVCKLNSIDTEGKPVKTRNPISRSASKATGTFGKKGGPS